VVAWLLIPALGGLGVVLRRMIGGRRLVQSMRAYEEP
jgi:hypothetical protein